MPTRGPAPRQPGRSINLRAVVILLSFLPCGAGYLNFLPRARRFDSRLFCGQHPDRRHGAVVRLRLFCAWLDVFLMSFFFLLSGLFWPTSTAKAPTFLADRTAAHRPASC